MRVVRAYRYALNLTAAQQRMVLAHVGQPGWPTTGVWPG